MNLIPATDFAPSEVATQAFAARRAPMWGQHELLAAKAESALRVSALPWTVLRPSGLSPEAPTGHWQLLSQAGATGAYLPRADLATAILEVVTDPRWLRQVVSVLGAALPG